MNSTSQFAKAITPSDSVDLPEGACRAIYVGVAGNVALRCPNATSTTVTFVGLAAGTILPVKASRVMATSTTATSLVALY